jgi:hypothetical protein
MPTARPTGRSPTISWWEQQRVGPKVIDETVRVTKRFLEEHPEEAKKMGVPKFPPIGGNIKIGVDIISRFLGWNHTRVSYSLERLKLIDEGILDKEAVESLPSDNAARDLVDGDYKRICVSMGMERKVEGCHIDGVISWSTAVQLFPAAASPFSARSSPPSAPTGILRRDACKRTSTTAISPPGRPPIIPPIRDQENSQVVSSRYVTRIGDPSPPLVSVSGSCRGGRGKNSFLVAEHGAQNTPTFTPQQDPARTPGIKLFGKGKNMGPGRSLLLDAHSKAHR